MQHGSYPTAIADLQACLSLSKDPTAHTEANDRFRDLLDHLAENEATAEALGVLWRELLAARRSAAFWQQLSDVEKELSDRLAETHVQLQQNYLRLVQEQ